jgi:type I restriction enzyme S subunit
MKKVNITNICEIQVGKTPSRSNPLYWGDGALWLSIADMNQGPVLESTRETITEKAIKECNCKIVPKNTVLFSFKLSIGKVGITKIPMYTNEAIAAFIIKDHLKIDTKYLFYVMKSVDYSIGSNKAVMGKTLNKAQLEKIEIPFPPLEKQKRIVKILDEADALRQKRKQAIALLDDYLKSMFLEMFGDPVRNPKRWKETGLDVLLTSMTSGSRGWSKYFADDGDIFLTIKNVGRGNQLIFKDITYVNPPNNAEAKRTKVREGDVLLSITADLGRTAVVPKLARAAYINQHLAILRLKDGNNPTYISYYISSDGGQLQINRMNKGAAKAGLNFNDIKSINIQLPPVEMQNHFALICEKAESIKQYMLAQSEELETQFQALMQREFR